MTHSLYSIIPLLVILVSIRADDPMINTPLGTVLGLELTFSETGDKIYQFRGIRFGKPTDGQRRFSKPEPFDKWSGVYDATSFGAICPQIAANLSDPVQSEDCLFLDVYVPKALNRQALSVMVWVYGGGLTTGYSQFYDASRLAVEGDVIVVTINYRVGIFGFLSLLHPSARGNWGLWDQHLAFQWVHDNILAFGGNPDSVTIFGQSAGGGSVSYQSILHINRGLFQRAIAQSGSVSRTGLLQKNAVEKLKNLLPSLTGCSSADLYQLVECLRTKTFEELVAISYKFFEQPVDRISLDVMYGVAVDGDLIPAHPSRLLANKTSPHLQFFRDIDYMSGTTSQEGSLVFGVFLTEAMQKNNGFNASAGIPASFMCNGMLKPTVDQFYNGSEDILRKLCAFYNSSANLDVVSNNAVDLWGDMSFVVDTAIMLDLHYTPDGCKKTYHYSFDRLGPVSLVQVPPYNWVDIGAGHGAELIFLFKNDDAVRGGPWDAKFNEDDRKASNMIIKYWSSYAKSG